MFNQVVSLQFIFILFLISGYSWIIIDSDIVFFDTYVLPDISYCYESNYEQEHCHDVRKITGCEDSKEQSCVGNVYWYQVTKQAVGLAALLFLLRLMPSIINCLARIKVGKTSRSYRKFRPIMLLESTWWAALALIIFLAGIIDWGYYTFRGMAVPSELPWLNHIGLFQYTKTFYGDPTIVNNTDLYVTLLIGISLIGISFLLVSYAHNRTKIKTLV